MRTGVALIASMIAAYALHLLANAWSSNPAAPMVFYASQSGKQTFDLAGPGGGNPFASALVHALHRRQLTLTTPKKMLYHNTLRWSHGRQKPELPPYKQLKDWQLLPKPPQETRIALVLVFANYKATNHARDLPGAKRDLQRVSQALRRAHFQVKTVLDPTRRQTEQHMQQFAIASNKADAALLYTTGHGLESNGKVYLLPNDYQLFADIEWLKERAVPLQMLTKNLRARRINLALYGGCRIPPP